MGFLAPSLFNGGSQKDLSPLYSSQAMGGVVSLSTFADGPSTLDFAVQPQLMEITAKYHSNGKSMALAYQQVTIKTLLTVINSTHNSTRVWLDQTTIRGRVSMRSVIDTSYGRDIGKSNIDYNVTNRSSYPSELHMLSQIQLQRGSDWAAKLFHHLQDWSRNREISALSFN